MIVPGRLAAGVVLLVVLLLAGGPAMAHPFGEPPTARLTAEGNRLLVAWSAAAGDSAALPAGRALSNYLLDRIRIAQRSQRCGGRVRSQDPSRGREIAVVYNCPNVIDVIDVEITMLHDRNEAYRTFAFADARPSQAVFTVAQPRHRLDFLDDSGEAEGIAVRWLQSAGLLAAAAAIGTGTRRRHQRREA